MSALLFFLALIFQGYPSPGPGTHGSHAAGVTWTNVQTVEAGFDNAACSGATCSVTISTLSAGHLGFIGTSLDASDDARTISSVNIGGSWVIPACHSSNGNDSQRCAYVLSTSAGGGHTLTVTLSGAPGNAWAFVFSEISKSSGAITLDGSITAGTGMCSGTTCTPGSVTGFSGSSDAVINLIGNTTGGCGGTFTGVASPYANFKGINSTCLDGYGNHLTASTGAGGAFTDSSSGDTFQYIALAFK